MPCNQSDIEDLESTLEHTSLTDEERQDIEDSIKEAMVSRFTEFANEMFDESLEEVDKLIDRINDISETMSFCKYCKNGKGGKWDYDECQLCVFNGIESRFKK